MAITRGSKSSIEEPAQTMKINAQLLLNVKKYVVSKETLENRLTSREFVEQAVMDRLKKVDS